MQGTAPSPIIWMIRNLLDRDLLQYIHVYSYGEKVGSVWFCVVLCACTSPPPPECDGIYSGLKDKVKPRVCNVLPYWIIEFHGRQREQELRTPDGYEPNDVVGEARCLSTGQTDVSFHDESDVDFFYFNVLEANQTIHFYDLPPDHPNHGPLYTYVRIYDVDGQTLLFEAPETEYSGEVRPAEYPFPVAGRYFLKTSDTRSPMYYNIFIGEPLGTCSRA